MKTIVLYDAAHQRTRQRIESILRAHGCTWLFPNARWSSRAVSAQPVMIRALRSRLAGQSYRIALIELPGRAGPHVRWIAATTEGKE